MIVVPRLEFPAPRRLLPPERLIWLRDRIVDKDRNNQNSPIITIKSVRVESVHEDPNGTGAIVITYDTVKNSLQLCAVYLGDLMPASKVENLGHDDRVGVAGKVFAYEPDSNKSRPVEAVRLIGVVVPVPKKPAQAKTKMRSARRPAKIDCHV